METTPNPMKLAILIDAENVVASHADLIFAQAEAMGEIVSKEIYGTAAALTAWVAPVLKYAIHPNLTIRATKGKNSSDIALVIGAMDLLLQGGVETIVIASSDSDFSALSVRLRNAGVNVVGMGMEKSNPLWRTACTSFIVLDHPTPAAKAQAAAPVEADAAPDAEPAPEAPKKPAAPKRQQQARTAAPTHKERVSIIEQFIQKRLDSSGGRLQVGSLFTGLNKLPEYKTDRQGSGRKPLNYLSSTFSEIFQFVSSADGKTWVSRVGTEPLPPGAEPLSDGAEAQPDAAPEEAEVVETVEAVEAPVTEEVPAEAEAPAAEEMPASEQPATEQPEEPQASQATLATLAPQATLAMRLIDGGMANDVAERIAPVFEGTANLRAAYNEIRKIFGNNDGRTYYHQAKAIIDAQAK